MTPGHVEGSSDAAPVEPERGGRRGGWRRGLRWLFLLLAVALLVTAAVQQWSAAQPYLGRLTAGRLAAALLPLFAALTTSMLSWRALLADLGSPLPVRAAAHVFFVGQLGKYVPGSLWVVLAQMELGRDYGVPRQRSGTASVLLYPLNVVVAVVVGLIALPFLAGVSTAWLVWTAPLLLASLAVLHARVLDSLLSPLLRRAGRQPLERLPTPTGMLRAGAWTAATFVLSGTHVWVLAAGVGAEGGRALPVAVGAWAAAWCVGFLLVVFPGGLGPREVTMVQLLGGVLPVAGAGVVAVVSRLLFTVAEVACALAAVAARRWGRQASPSGPSPGGS